MTRLFLSLLLILPLTACADIPPPPPQTPEPEPQPDQSPDPQPVAQPDPTPDMMPTPDPEPAPTPDPTPEPTPDPTPDMMPTPNPEPAPTPDMMPDPDPEMGPLDPGDCAPLDQGDGQELCAASTFTCEGVFHEGQGCAQWCDQVGLRCEAAFENAEGLCAPNTELPPLDCNTPSGHNSDYCVCGLNEGCVPQCGDRLCGLDGCGGLCGRCGANEVCNNQGVCEIDGPWEALLAERIGFGRETTGGAGGPLCTVTNLNPSGAGSLRECAATPGARWINFAVSGRINLGAPIDLTSDKTIDGRGQNITIINRGLRLSSVNNVIIHNIAFAQGGGDNQDAIQINNGTQRVWVDRVTLEDFSDGLLDITVGATDITVSNCHFRNQNKVMLIGANIDHTGDTNIRVTLHHNWFEATTQRHPRIRYGKVHAFNNYYDEWLSYAIGASQNSQLLSEHNIFEAGDDNTAIQVRVGEDTRDGKVESRRELLLGGAIVDENDTEAVFEARDFYTYTLEDATTGLRSRIRNNAGRRDTPFPTP